MNDVTIRYEAPKGYVLIQSDEYDKYEHWVSNRKAIPTVWTLKEFAATVFHRKGTTKALNFLLAHKDELDIANGGFIDFENTRGGWNIPAEQIKDFYRSCQPQI